MGKLVKQLAHAGLMAGIMLGMSATAQADEPELHRDGFSISWLDVP